MQLNLLDGFHIPGTEATFAFMRWMLAPCVNSGLLKTILLLGLFTSYGLNSIIHDTGSYWIPMNMP